MAGFGVYFLVDRLVLNADKGIISMIFKPYIMFLNFNA
jgi:hypothetical protein